MTTAVAVVDSAGHRVFVENQSWWWAELHDGSLPEPVRAEFTYVRSSEPADRPLVRFMTHEIYRSPHSIRLLAPIPRTHMERILIAACWFDDGVARQHQPVTTGFVIAGWGHPSIMEQAQKGLWRCDGFLTSRGRFLDRFDALAVAVMAGQVPSTLRLLTSEDLRPLGTVAPEKLDRQVYMTMHGLSGQARRTAAGSDRTVERFPIMGPVAAVALWSKDDDAYVATSNDWPGLAAHGETATAAAQELLVAVAGACEARQDANILARLRSPNWDDLIGELLKDDHIPLAQLRAAYSRMSQGDAEAFRWTIFKLSGSFHLRLFGELPKPDPATRLGQLPTPVPSGVVRDLDAATILHREQG